MFKSVCEWGGRLYCTFMLCCILFVYIHIYVCVCVCVCVCMYVCVGGHIIFTDISAGSGSLVIKWHHLGIIALLIVCSTGLSQAFSFFFFCPRAFFTNWVFLISGRNYYIFAGDVLLSLQAIHGPTSQTVLEEAKAHFQEQLLRKAAQREADAAMDEEQKR